ncbi:MAG: hypothetical protein ABIQ59_05515 [Nocardioidaceae bacterium]
MARDDDEDAHWSRQLLVAVGVLVAVALVIGGVVSVVALGAANVSGIDDARTTATAKPSLFIPSGEPTTRPEQYPDPVGSGGSDAASPSATPSKSPTKRPRAISLQAFPRQVSANERINLTGVYAGAEGTSLQVQRFEGSWIDFPVDASVKGGAFTTYVYTGRSGLNRFRVVDQASGKKSNAVRVTIG